MKLKQFLLRETETPTAQKTSHHNDNPFVEASSQSEDDQLLSFTKLDLGVPRSDSWEKRVSWVQSQIIGGVSEFDSPFGKRKLIYVDHNASGRSLYHIEHYIIDNVLPFYGNTHTCDSYVGQRTTKMVHEATQYVKRCLGGGEDDAIMFCGSGTTAAIKRLQEVMGIAVASTMREKIIKSLSNEERWVVFVGPYEHHSNLLSWRQSLAEVVEIGLDSDGLIDIAALTLKLDSYKGSNRPLLGSFSACSNVTGIYSDTRAIATLLHQYGAFACFDFAASGPYVEIDMRSGEMDGYDAIYLSGHKFLGGPGSPGILLMSKALYQLNSFPPSTCGGGTVNFVNGFSEKDTLYLEDIEARENGGTPQIIQLIRAACAFWVKEYIGYEVIKKQEEMYITKALQRLLPNQNIKVLGNTSVNRQAILSFLIFTTTNTPEGIIGGEFSFWGQMGNKRGKPLHGAFVAILLNDLFGIQARGGCACAGPYAHSLLDIDEIQSCKLCSAIQKGYVGVKPGWTRISFPYYMSNDEFEFILAAVEFIAAYGQRFLPLYDFNLKTGNWCFKKALHDLTSKENNHIFHMKPLASAIKEISKFKDDKTSDSKHLGMIRNYATYFETARHIAGLLPKFPCHGSLPEDINPDILLFRI